MTLLLDSIFLSIAFGHLLVDLLGSQRSILFTYIGNQLGMTNAALGLVSTVYVWVASLSQPLFGWLSDRVGTRWLVAGGVLWMGTFFSLAMFLPGYAALAALTFASLGSAAFHPSATAEVTRQGNLRFAGRETTAASYFFTFGQAAYAFGPMVGGILLGAFGMRGLLIFAALALPIGLNASLRLRPMVVKKTERKSARLKNGEKRLTVGKSFLFALAFATAFQAWIQQTMNTFIPKYLSDLGQSVAVYGIITGLYMAGAAVGNILGGNLADKFGKQRVAATALALASLPLFLISRSGWTLWLYLLVPLAGALNGSVHSILVVLAQHTIRGGRGLASGLVLGFKFSAGALGMLLSGVFADLWGFSFVFTMTAGLALSASILIQLLKEPPQEQTVIS